MHRFFLGLLAVPLACLVASAQPPQTQMINDGILEGYKKADISKPAAKSTDLEFLRRVFIDLIGRIPTREEVLDFEQDKAKDKRAKLVHRLLNERKYEPTVDGKKTKLPEVGGHDLGDYAAQHAAHWANQWTVWLISRSAHRLYRQQLSTWLEDQFADNKPYDQIVRELITAKGESNKNGAVTFVAFHLGEKIKPEERNQKGYFDAVPITSRVTKLFLGIQTQCVQCHDHPFNEHWIQKDFWGVNAFFRQTSRSRDLTPGTGNAQQMANPVSIALSDDDSVNKEAFVSYEPRNGTLKDVYADFLKDYKVAEEKGKSRKRLPDDMKSKSRREVLADYLINHDNFGRALVSRVWGHLFGRGLHKDPTIDDFGAHNEIIHADMLNKLAKEFKEYKYNTKALLEWICNSDVYQLSHVAQKEYIKDDYNPFFARMPLKALSPEVLYDSLITATRYEPPATTPGATAANNRRQGREDWLGKLVRNFGDDEGNELTFNGTVVQALLMMNGRELNEAVTKKGENVVEAIVKKHTIRGAIGIDAVLDDLFLTTVSRHPTPDELKAIKLIYAKYTDPKAAVTPPKTGPQPKGPNKPTTDKPTEVLKDALHFYQDVFWALLNTNEFMLNH